MARIRVLLICSAFLTCVGTVHAEDVLFSYEGDRTPASGRWDVSDCEFPCEASIEDGYLVLKWQEATRFSGYIHRINEPPSPPPKRFGSSGESVPTTPSPDIFFAMWECWWTTKR